ncbi:MAG: SDR family oxidoreductase [Chloroflexi bacterium]|nr:SDR family oxidoreductase [Chloroflexota bacterium]MCC6893094.1 SDR family oxidoreductase [Anaerolineae bacterium]
MKVKDKTIVVTGAGSGMGRALALGLVNRGARVAAVDLNENALNETVALAGGQRDNISVHVVNVTDRKAVEALPEAVIQAHNTVDGIINNAGIIQPFVRFNDLTYEAIERVMNVNLYGVIYMTKTFLPHLYKRPTAHIVNVSSMGGFFPVPGQTVYGASKAAVKLLSEGLYSELTETNIRVTVVFPGAIATNITQNSGVAIPAAGGSESSQSFPTTSAPDAAAIIINGMERDQFQVYVGNDAKMMNFLYRASPKRATRFMYSRMKGLLPK